MYGVVRDARWTEYVPNWCFSGVDTANQILEADQMAVTAMIAACGQGNVPLLVKRAIDTANIQISL